MWQSLPPHLEASETLICLCHSARGTTVARVTPTKSVVFICGLVSKRGIFSNPPRTPQRPDSSAVCCAPLGRASVSVSYCLKCMTWRQLDFYSALKDISSLIWNARSVLKPEVERNLDPCDPDLHDGRVWGTFKETSSIFTLFEFCFWALQVY